MGDKKNLYKKRALWSITLVLMAIMLISTGCNNQPEVEKDQLQVYTSSYVLADFTEKIAGELVDVTNIIPPGVDSHDFEPSARQMADLQNANLFLYNGAGLDAWVNKLSDAMKEKVLFVDSTQNISLITREEEDEHQEDERNEEGSHEDEHGHEGEIDPHVWLDPTNAILQSETIKDALIQIDPENNEVYQQNFNTLKEELIKLDELYLSTLENAKRKHIFVSHSAFGYLTKRYKLEQVAITGLNPQDEPSPQEMMNIVNKAREFEIEYILMEPLVQSKYAQTIMKEIGAKSLILHPIDGLTKSEIEKGEDYFSIMKNNLEVLKVALGVS